MSAGKRAICARCDRPPRACFCRALPAVALRTAATHVLVLQHEREQRRRQAISSVPVLRLVLPLDVDVVRVADACECGPGADARADELLYAEEGEAAADFAAALVLFPAAEAAPLGERLRRELGLDDRREGGAGEALAREGGERCRRRVLLVAIDGTWAEAKKIAFRNRVHWEKAAESWRRRGKRFELVCLGANGGDGDSQAQAQARAAVDAEAASSIYGDLRREPMDGCLSTLEAVERALRVLEPPSSAGGVSTALLDAFRGMVAVQSAFQQRGKAEALRRYGGVSKEAAVRAQARRGAPVMDSAAGASTHGRADAAGLRREYVFYRTLTDFRQRQELVQQGDAVTCTYDQARDKCGELNVGRKRGERLAFLPRDVFDQKQALSGRRALESGE